jgi:hypothetical protein
LWSDNIFEERATLLGHAFYLGDSEYFLVANAGHNPCGNPVYYGIWVWTMWGNANITANRHETTARLKDAEPVSKEIFWAKYKEALKTIKGQARAAKKIRAKT